MTAPPRETRGLGMPWEDTYGYAQAVRVGDTIYVSGQPSHDDAGNLVGPAPLGARGEILDHGNMAVQMRRAYANAAAGPVRKQAYGRQRAGPANSSSSTSAPCTIPST